MRRTLLGKILGVGLVAVIAFDTLPVKRTQAEEPIVAEDVYYGDLNGDGLVNAKDVTMLKRNLAGGWDIEIDPDRADVNLDGEVNAKDITVLRRYLAGGWGVTLPDKTLATTVYDTWDEYVQAGGVDEEIEFKDKGLKDIIINSIRNQGKSLKVEGAIWRSDIYELRYIGDVWYGVKDLTGLGELVNLQMLNIATNEVSDISELAKLTNLQDLMIQHTSVRDLTPIKNLHKLKYLYVSGDSDLKNVEALGDMSGLESVVLSGCINLSDISPLYNLDKLKSLYINDTAVTSLEGIENLQGLTGIGISGIPAIDTNRIFSLPNLTYIEMDADSELLMQVCEIYPNLEGLELNCNGEEIDATPITSLTKLTGLYISEAKINNISVIGNMESLTDMSLCDDDLTDISFVESLTNLEYFNISDNKVSNLKGVGSLNNLKTFVASFNKINDISVLGGLENLSSIYLNDNHSLETIAPIMDLPNLSWLNVSGTKVPMGEIKALKDANPNVYISCDYSNTGFENDVVYGYIPCHFGTNNSSSSRVVFDNDYNAQLSVEYTYDDNSRVIGIVATKVNSEDSVTATFEYDENGVNIKTTWNYSDGTRYVWEYDENERLTHAIETGSVPYYLEVSDYGYIIRYGYRAWETNPDEKLLLEYTNTYDTDGNLVKIVCQNTKTNEILTAVYTYENGINTETNWNYESGKKEKWEFNEKGKITKRYYYEGHERLYIPVKYYNGSYDAHSVDVGVATVEYTYDDQDNCTKIICADLETGKTLTVTFEYTGTISTKVDWLWSDGTGQGWEYDSETKKEISYYSKYLDCTTTFEYYPDGRVKRIVTTDVEGRIWYDEYEDTENHYMIKSVNSEGVETYYQYDTDGRLVKEVGYDVNGELIYTRNKEFITINGKGYLSKDNRSGNGTDYVAIPVKYSTSQGTSYDSFWLGNYTLVYSYDNDGKCVKAVCTMNDTDRVLTAIYEYEGNVNTKTTWSYSDGEEQWWEYDALGKIVSSYSKNQYGTTMFEYNSDGQLIKLTQYADDKTVIESTEYVIRNGSSYISKQYYDGEGNYILIPIKIVNGSNANWDSSVYLKKGYVEYSYNDFNNYSSIVCTDLDNNSILTVTYEYVNKSTTKVSWNWSNGDERVLEYDEYGNNFRIFTKYVERGEIDDHEYYPSGNSKKYVHIYPDGTCYSCEYDESGNRVKQVDRDGSVSFWGYEYDDDGNIVKELVYDSEGNLVDSTEYVIINGESRISRGSGEGNLESIMSSSLYMLDYVWEEYTTILCENRYEYNDNGDITKITCTRLDSGETVIATYKYENGLHVKTEWKYSDETIRTWNLKNDDQGNLIEYEYIDPYGNIEEYEYDTSYFTRIKRKTISDSQHYGDGLIWVISGPFGEASGYDFDFEGYLVDYEYCDNTAKPVNVTIADLGSDAVFKVYYEYNGNNLVKVTYEKPDGCCEIDEFSENGKYIRKKWINPDGSYNVCEWDEDGNISYKSYNANGELES